MLQTSIQNEIKHKHYTGHMTNVIERLDNTPREKNVTKNRKKCEPYKRIYYGYNKNEWLVFRRKDKKNFYENTTNEKRR